MNTLTKLKVALFFPLAIGLGSAQAATVTYSNISDGNGVPALFDVGATLAVGNTLNIGVNNFKADGSLVPASSLDTLTFKITAPSGYWITGVSYLEGGNGKTANGVAIATGSMTADGVANNFLTQVFGTNTTAGWTIDSYIPVAKKDEIWVSIVNSLFAVALLNGNDAWIAKTSAALTAEIAPVPLPPAVWLLGSALAGLVVVSRRKREASGTAIGA